MDKILEAKNIGITFGGLKAVDGFNVTIGKNELIGLIGPNGAGKTTIFNILTGVYTPTSGEYYLNGKKIEKMSPHRIVEEGLGRTFQNIRLFKYLTVLQNVMAAFNYRMKYSPITGMLRLPSYWKEEKEIKEKAIEILKIFGLDSMIDLRAGQLPYGAQRKLEIARAMATNPKILLLDEPAAGMNPIETDELMDTIRLIRKRFDISVLLIEHDMKLVLGICERIMVLDYGKLIAMGKPDEIVKNKDVIKAYLGGD